jgi:hypothetical protein
MKSPLLNLTWAGLDTAVDIIAAQCRRHDLIGVYGADVAGRLLAIALADRLGILELASPEPQMLMVRGVVFEDPGETLEGVESWAWVDASPAHRWDSVMKVDGSVAVLFPWQDATSRMRAFVPGFDD